MGGGSTYDFLFEKGMTGCKLCWERWELWLQDIVSIKQWCMEWLSESMYWWQWQDHGSVVLDTRVSWLDMLLMLYTWLTLAVAGMQAHNITQSQLYLTILTILTIMITILTILTSLMTDLATISNKIRPFWAIYDDKGPNNYYNFVGRICQVNKLFRCIGHS